MQIKELKLLLVGFGNVGREFARIMLEKGGLLEDKYGCRFSIVGIATYDQGMLVNSNGIDMKRALDEINESERFLSGNPDISNMDTLKMISSLNADVMIEMTPLSIMDGEPAITHIETSLKSGKHVISCNKGPVAWKYSSIKELATKVNRAFLHECVVMDGTPVFNMVEDNLPGCVILGFRGILNSTTNFILQEIENGGNFDDAVYEAQCRGFAEADPSMDIDGWDAAAKTAALMNALMDTQITPMDIKREGIADVTPDMLQKAKKEGYIYKLLCMCAIEEGKPVGRVSLKRLPLSDPLAGVSGTSSALTLQTDLMGSLTVFETDPEITQTGYAVLSDLVRLVRKFE